MVVVRDFFRYHKIFQRWREVSEKYTFGRNLCELYLMEEKRANRS